jgi:flagella basal body P-ring formation protein FlgA
MADAVVIGGRIALIPADKVEKGDQWFYAALLDYIENQDTYKRGRIEIELANTPLFLESLRQEGFAAQGAREYQVVFENNGSPYTSGAKRSISSNLIPAGTMQLSYRVLSSVHADLSGRGQVQGTLRLWIHHFVPVARAAVDLAANQPLSEDVLSYAEEDISLLRTSFFLRGEEADSYQTVASIRRGERIDPGRLQKYLAVRAGDRVRITFARPGLSISLPGRAFRSGGIGDIIAVRPQETDKRFQARITSQGEVFVESY